MRYLFQRVIHNGNGWTAPSPGRLQFPGDGSYLKDTGFGHEDWNLANDICADGNAYGYTYYVPKDPSGLFNILFATYDKGEGWSLCGYYVGAKFRSKGGNFSQHILHRRATELKALDAMESLGDRYRRASIEKIVELLRIDAQHYRWIVKPNCIHRFQIPVRIPKSLTEGFGCYFTRPTELTKPKWNRLIKAASKFKDKDRKDDYTDGGDTEFPEGRVYEAKHKVRERSKKAVEEAKTRFKNKFGRLFCEACSFDFVATYGVGGEGFIEAHHRIPVSELRRGAKTRASDLALVCSNCHRILHRQRPLMEVEALRQLIRKIDKAKSQ